MTKISDARLSEDIERDAQFDLSRRVEILEMANGFEERNTPQAHHRRMIGLSYGPRDTAKIRAVRDAWSVCLGPIYAFRFKDWSDYKTSADGSAPAASDQLLGLGDGVTLDFQLSKTVSFGVSSYTHPIKAPVLGSVLIEVDGVAQSEGPDYAIDIETGLISFVVAPAIGLDIRAGCRFDVWVRFASEQFSMSHLLYGDDGADAQISQTAAIDLIEVLE